MVEVEVALEWKGVRYQNIERGLVAVGEDVKRDIEKAGPLVRKLLRQYMEGVVKSVKARTVVPYPAGTSAPGQFPGSLSRRSGKLSASLTPERIQVKGGSINSTEVSFTLTGIASVHERGATIRPKRAKYLTIPLPPALDSRGVPKEVNARAWQNTFVQRSRKGNLLIFQKRGQGIVPLYVLKKSVTIPRRLNFDEAFQAGRDLLADKIAKEVVREFFGNAG